MDVMEVVKSGQRRNNNMPSAVNGVYESAYTCVCDVYGAKRDNGKMKRPRLMKHEMFIATSEQE